MERVKASACSGGCAAALLLHQQSSQRSIRWVGVSQSVPTRARLGFRCEAKAGLRRGHENKARLERKQVVRGENDYKRVKI